MRAVMRKVLITILCLCSFLSAATASEKPLMLGALRGPAHDTAIALAAELSETLKRPVIIKAFEDKATMYVWLDRYRMIDFALTSRVDLAPGQLHRLGPVPVADTVPSVEMIGHGGLPREVLLQVRDWLAAENRDRVAVASSSGKSGGEGLTSEPAEVSPETADEADLAIPKDIVEIDPVAPGMPDVDGIKSFLSNLDPSQGTPERALLEEMSAEPDSATTAETTPFVSVDVVEVDAAASEEQAGADNITGLLSHWGLDEDAPEGAEASLAGESGVLSPEALSPEPDNQENLTLEPVAVMLSPEDSTADPVVVEEQSDRGGIGEMLGHWGLSAKKASEGEKIPAGDAQPPSLKPLPVASAAPVEAAEETTDQQGGWGGIGDLFNQWGADTEEPAENQADAVTTVVMDASPPRSFDAPVGADTPAPVVSAEPSGPLVVHLIPLTRVMIPERVENRLLEEFSRLLQQQDRTEQVRFVEHEKPLSQIEPSWLEQHHSLAGEIFSYQEKTGHFSTSVRMRGRFYYRAPAHADSPWQEEVPVKISFDPNETTLEEAQDQLVVELAAVLAEAFFAEISPE